MASPGGQVDEDTRARKVVAILAVAVAYAAVAKFGSLTTTLTGGVSPIFPAAGIALAAALMLPRWSLAGVWLGSAGANALIFGKDLSWILEPRQVLVETLVGAGAVLAAWAGAWLVRRFCAEEHPLGSARNVALLTGAAFGAAAVSATVGLLTLSLTGFVPWRAFAYSWLTWFLGDGFGSVVGAPLVLAWHGQPWRRLRPWRVTEATALGGVTLLLGDLVFFRSVPFEYGLMPLLAWAAFRFGMRGTSAAAAAIAVLAAVGTSLGSSPFARATVNDSLLALDSFLAVTVVFSMLLAGVLVERTSAYEALEDSKERFAAMFNCSTNFIALTDAVTGAILDLNDKLIRASGMSRNEAVGRTAVELGLWPSLETRGELVTALKREGRLRGHEVTLQTAAGPRDCAVNAEFVDVRGHRLVLWEIRDLTETRRAQQEKERLTAQLLQSQKMEAVGQLAGGVAHDFNNLLTVIINNCDLTLEDPRLGSEPRQNVEMVREAGESAANLTRQLLAFSRKQVLQPSRIDLNALVTRLERMLRRVIGEDVELVTRLGAGLWPILADPGQIEQVIVNLAVNSRDAMPDGGSLTLETGNVVLDEDYAGRYPEASPGEHAMLAVTDTGVGMDAATLSRIFEPFFSTKGHRGTGLGLSTVHGIVRQSGGHLVPHSEPGQGTMFRIYLPRYTGTDEVVEPRAGSVAARLRGETVLVVEDSPSVRKLVASLLVRRGHRVLQAGGAAEALEVAGGHPGPIDLLITDVVMPGMSGRQMAAELVASRPDLAVLYMSGYAQDTIVKEGVLQPGIEFIAKPFTNDSFARKVDEVLGRRAGR